MALGFVAFFCRDAEDTRYSDRTYFKCSQSLRRVDLVNTACLLHYTLSHHYAHYIDVEFVSTQCLQEN
jgi:hypothetical protein